MMQKTWKITETLAYGYSPESTQRELSDEYQHDRVNLGGYQKCLPPYALDKSSLSIRRFNPFIPALAKKSVYFCDISLMKAIFGKYLKEKCWSKSNLLYLQFSFKYFCEFLLLSRYFPGPDDWSDYLSDISPTKAIVRKYLKENCLLELYLQLSVKYFLSLCFIYKLSSKVWQVQTTPVK